MIRFAFGVSVVALALSGSGAAAEQPPWAGGPPPIGDLFGYSPLTHSINPFPSRTSGYAHSMFLPNGGKRIYPVPNTVPNPPVVIISPNAATAPSGPTVIAGPVQTVAPARGLRRFSRW